jgi:hypothetical protein
MGIVTVLSSVLPFSYFFPFLISPTCRNYGLIRTLHGSNDVFRLVHVLFQGLKPSNSLFGGLQPEKYRIFHPFFLNSPTAAEIA